MDDDGLVLGMILGAVVMMAFVVMLALIFDWGNAGPNGQCAAIGGEYVTELGSCVVDDEVVPLPVE